MPPGELKKCFSAYCELHIAGPDCPGSPDVPLPCPYTSGDHASVRVPSSPWWPTHDKSCPSPTGRLSGFFQLLGIQIYSCLQKYLPANCSQACPVLVWMVPARKREWFALLRGPLAPSAGSGVALQAAFLTDSRVRASHGVAERKGDRNPDPAGTTGGCWGRIMSNYRRHGGWDSGAAALTNAPSWASSGKSLYLSVLPLCPP